MFIYLALGPAIGQHCRATVTEGQSANKVSHEMFSSLMG